MDTDQDQRTRYQAERKEILEDFGLKLAARRIALPSPPKRRTTSQRELGDRASLHRNLISSLERGKHEPGLLTLLILADTLGATPAELLEGLPAPHERNPARKRKRAGR